MYNNLDRIYFYDVRYWLHILFYVHIEKYDILWNPLPLTHF